MASSVLLGKYLPIKSVIHQIDARVKIIATLLYLVALFITNSLYMLGVAFVFVIVLALFAKIPMRNLISSLKPIRLLIVFMIVFNLFFYTQGQLVFKFGFIKIYDEAITRTVFFAVRIIIMVLYSSVLTLTTAPLDLSSGIEALLKPFKKLEFGKFNFPAHEIGMMISIALRFIPTLFEETDKIMKAQASRGIDFKNGKIKEKVKGIVALLIPLFINSLKRADDLANAMEIRGYTGGDNRTDLHEYKFGVNETIYLVIHVILIALVIFIR